uniref:Reactive oxygen species modulator 1 n=1 Tax=Cyprinus carpio carpio TaxID=630221 RepID=A0A8C1HE10_CYPCA
MPVTVGPYGQTQPSCFDRVKMGFMMGFAVGMAAGAMFGTFSCLRQLCFIQDRHEGSRVDGRSWEDDDAKRWHVWNLHVHWDGYPLLRSH